MGYQPITGELLRRNVGVSATAIRTVLVATGSTSAATARSTWRAFLRQQPAGSWRVTCFTVATVWLRRLSVLVFIEVATRWVYLAGVTANPDGTWVTQQAHNLLLVLGARGGGCASSSATVTRSSPRDFDDVFGWAGAQGLLAPVRAPKANAYAERWVPTVGADGLDWLLIVGRGTWSGSCESMASTTTSTAGTGCWGSKRRIDLPGWPSSVGINKAGCVGVTCLVVSFMSISQPHEHLCAPFR